jgi:hypothetical protein
MLALASTHTNRLHARYGNETNRSPSVQAEIAGQLNDYARSRIQAKLADCREHDAVGRLRSAGRVRLSASDFSEINTHQIKGGKTDFHSEGSEIQSDVWELSEDW